MKINRLVLLSTVASAALIASSMQELRASNQNRTPSTPYETWSTHKVMTMSPERMSKLTAPKHDSFVRVRTSTGSERTLELGAPIGKI